MLKIIIIIVKIPIAILKTAIQHPKVALIGIGLIIIVIALTTCGGGIGGTKKQVVTAAPLPAYQKDAPSKEIAPFELVTPTRIYYVARYKDTKDALLLNDYFTFDSTWARKTTDLNLIKKYYPGSKLYNRSGNKLILGF